MVVVHVRERERGAGEEMVQPKHTSVAAVPSGYLSTNSMGHNRHTPCV